MWYPLLRPLLFALPPEAAHSLALSGLRALAPAIARLGALRSASPLSLQAMGLEFPNPVGVAAGLDKDATCIEGLAALGFGFIEVGTVTPKPQAGNPRPRLFRLHEDDALVNRMGFNNQGMDAMARSLARTTYTGILGINIGKNRDTPVERAHQDYVACMRRLYPFASYFTVNLSSPNTPGLRTLQQGAGFAHLLDEIKGCQTQLATTHLKYVPVVVKVAPDLDANEVADLAGELLQHEIDGVIATNTTTAREGLRSAASKEAGGLSGRPLMSPSTAVVAQLHERLQRRVPIIGSGGIFSGADACAKQAAGARLVQLYTGLIYRGPGLIREVQAALTAQAEQVRH